MSDAALIKLDAAQHALAECKTAMEAKQISDVAEAARVYLERTNASTETVQRAAEIRTLAERQMGEFLKKMPKNHGANGSVVSGSSREPVKDTAPTLREIGITKKQSMNAQRLASISPEEIRQRVAIIKEGGDVPTPAAVLTMEPNNGNRPIPAFKCSPAQEAEIKRASKDSTALSSLKRYWRQAGKRDRAAFLAWMKSN